MSGSGKSKEELIEWAMGILTLEIPFCSDLMEDKVIKAIKILLTYLPDPYLGVTYKEKIFLKEDHQNLVCTPEQAFNIINNQ